MAYPKDFKYTKEHEWIKADGTNATIGITNYAQESLGDIVFVELPKIGSDITAGKTFGSVESVKAVSDLYAPASGKVTAATPDADGDGLYRYLADRAAIAARLWSFSPAQTANGTKVAARKTIYFVFTR